MARYVVCCIRIFEHSTFVDIETFYEGYVLMPVFSCAFLLQSPASLRSEEYRQLFRLPADEVSELRHFQCLLVRVIVLNLSWLMFSSACALKGVMRGCFRDFGWKLFNSCFTIAMKVLKP